MPGLDPGIHQSSQENPFEERWITGSSPVTTVSMALTVSKFWPSKRLAEKFRALQPISPRQFDRFGNTDPQPRNDVRFFRTRMQRDGRGVQRQAVVLVGNPKRFRQLARPRAQQSLIMQSTAPAHRGDAVGRLQGAEQHCTCRTLLLADEIDAPVNAIGAIDIGNAWRPE